MAAKKADLNTINIEFEYEKDTKNKYRYSEVGLDDVIGTLYIAKRVLGATPPAKLTISLTTSV